MFCPNYRNKEVFDGFNELIEAFGGEPMTEEEFRDSELRNQRTGSNYSAMEAAYRVYDQNGGNFLDKTPLGKQSILFLSLLDLFNGDRIKAIIAKSNVYSLNFFNWFGNWVSQILKPSEDLVRLLNLVYTRTPELLEIGTVLDYARYVSLIFPNSVDKNVYWHGTDEDLSDGFNTAKRGKGSGAPETQSRNDFYLARQAWSVLQYVSGVNRKSVDKNGFAHWNKLWWELKEIMSNGRRENNDWKDLVINETNVRQAIPNKRGVFNRDKGGENGKWLSERKADYGYENKTDRKFFEEILGIKWGEDTFNTWVQRNAEVFKQLESSQKGIYPAVINTTNPIRESGLNTYYEEQRGLFTQADREGNDAILGANTDNEFGSDVAVVINASNNNVHFLGTKSDVEAFRNWLKENSVSKVVDDNGEPLIVYHGTDKIFSIFDISHAGESSGNKASSKLGFFFTDNYNTSASFANVIKVDNGSVAFYENEGWWENYTLEEADVLEEQLEKDKPFVRYGPSDYITELYAKSKNSRVISVFLNIKNPKFIEAYEFIDASKNNIAHDEQKSKEFKNALVSENHDGIVITNDAEIMNSGEFDAVNYVTFESNQVKSVLNLGTFDPDNADINMMTSSLVSVELNQFNDASMTSTFGNDITNRLLNDEYVSSEEIINALLLNNAVDADNVQLARILTRHNIPIKLDSSIGGLSLATTITDNNTGNSIVLLNPDLISQVTNRYLSTAVLHEVVHAVTVQAINNPTTKEQAKFKELNSKVFNKFKNSFPQHSDLFNDVDSGYYALTNEKEFAAVFITDEHARYNFIQLARELDLKENGRFINLFRRFINSITQLFVNKDVFKSNESQVLEYQREFIKYPAGVPTMDQASKLSKEELNALYDKINIKSLMMESAIDKMKYLSNYSDAIERNDLVAISFRKPGSKQQDVIENKYSFEDIENKLQLRINAIRTSDLKPSERSKLLTATQNQLELFLNEQTSKYIAIVSTIKQVAPQINEDIKELKKINMRNMTISGRDYMYLLHSNFALYQQIARAMDGLLDQSSTVDLLLKEYNADKKEQELLTRQDLMELKSKIANLISVTSEGVTLLEIMGQRTAYGILRKEGENSNNSEDIEEYLLNLTQNPTFSDNINWFELNFGAMDSSTSESLRVLSHIVNRALKKADVKVQNRTIELLELLNNLKSGESVLDLYEEDEHGRTTGYLVRKLNYGRFYKDYDEELKRINSIISKKYNIILEDTNRTAPENNEQARREWNQMKNDWLATHCERKYIKEYYDIWNDVPLFARASLASINAEIASILQKPNLLDDKGHYHYDRLSDDEWNTFVNLTILKKLLYSDYDRAGNLKEPGTVEYETAKALLNLNNKLNELRGGDENKKLKKDREAWLEALEEEKEACGGKEAYDKWKNGEDDHGFNVKRFKKWHERNSVYTFKTDAEGNAIIFKDMELALHEIKVDYGQRYEDLKQKANDLLKPYRGLNGEILAKEIPDAVQNLLQEIWRELYKIRRKLLKSNKALSQVAKKQSQVFKHFFEFKDTEYYKDIKRELRALAKDSSTGEFNQLIFESLLSNYGNFIYDYSSGIDVGFKPYRWLLKMVAIDRDKYMEYQPGWAWTEKSDNTDILNPKFVDAENTSMIPKKELYDNSKLWNKILNSDSLKALYYKVHETMHESNEMQTNRLFADDFLLPQMTGTVWKRMKRHPFFKKLDILALYFAESLGLGSKTNYKLNTAKVSSIGAGLGIASGLIVGSPLFAAFTGVVGLGLGLTAAGIFSSDAISANDYSSVGSNQALDNNNPEAKKNISSTPIKGQYPDGRSFHILPQYYTRRLENPTQISSDLVNIVSNYYKMSCYYDEKVRIKDDCETLVDFIRSQKSKSSTQYSDNNANKAAVQDKESNTFKAAETFLEMNLYDMKRTRVVKNIGPIELQWSKTASLWKNWTTRRNLGLNPKVALTGFLTTMGVHLLQSITGQQYGFLTGLTSWFEVLGRIGKNLCGARYIGNYLSKDKLMLCAEWYNVASQFERKYEGTNRNKLLNSLNRHSVFGMLSTIDFISKAIIMVSILKDHHLVDGEFVSKDDIKLNRYQYSDEEFKSKINQWKKGESLYSVIKGGDTKIKVDEKYKEAFEKSDFKIKDRVQKLTEYADGMATDLQRASITQNIIGSFILIHRQYLPLIVQRYFGKMVYDYDTELMKNGVFRTLFNYVGEVMKNNLALGIGAGAFTGGAFAGPLGVFLGVTSAFGFRAYGAYQHRNGIESKSMKLINKETFSDFSNKKSTRTSYQNRYNMTEVASTVLLYNIIVAPLASLVCSIADNDDDKRWWLLMLAFAARAFLWEFYTAFRTDDLLNNIKSPTAATSVLDAVEQFGNGLTTSATKIFPVTINTLFPQSNLLFDPSQAWDDATNIIGGESRKIKKGSYKDWEPWQRNVVKMSPVHNLIEQVKDSKSKRNYIENQIMHLPKDE